MGELLTDLFCDYSEEIAVRRENLLPLAAQFGRGLQLVNILKDVWEDQLRGTCWLPRSAFAPDLDLASPETSGSPAFIDGLTTLVAAARDYLDAAFEYVLLIPPQQTGIRRFLLWTLGLAVLTLRRIHANPHYASGDEVKGLAARGSGHDHREPRRGTLGRGSRLDVPRRVRPPAAFGGATTVLSAPKAGLALRVQRTRASAASCRRTYVPARSSLTKMGSSVALGSKPWFRSATLRSLNVPVTSASDMSRRKTGTA